MRAGSLLQDKVVAASKLVDLSVEDLQYVFNVNNAVGGWIVQSK